MSLFTYLCVENPLLEINKVVITKKEVEVLEGFCEKERLLHIVLVCLNLQEYQLDVARGWDTFMTLTAGSSIPPDATLTRKYSKSCTFTKNKTKYFVLRLFGLKPALRIMKHPP